MNIAVNQDVTRLGAEEKTPPPFRPAALQAAWLQRGIWRLSLSGRAKLSLWVARQTAAAEVDRAPLEKILTRLQASRGEKNAAVTSLIHELLLHLALSSVHQNAPADATRWLAELDRCFPDSFERLSIRWELLEKIRPRRVEAEFAPHARAFLADPLAANYTGAVLRTVQAVYELLPLARRIELAPTVNPSLARDPRVREALILWQCPGRFTSQEEASMWGGQLQPEHLRFAPSMRIDALLVAARAAEWANDAAGMEAQARAILLETADSLPALFCLARARLLQPDGGVPGELDFDRAPTTPEWQRLRLQCQLRAQPDLAHAAALLPVLEGKLGEPDAIELGLTLNLLSRTLSSASAREIAHLPQCAELSARLKSLATELIPRLPFHKCVCSQCESTIEFPTQAAGRTVPCPRCDKQTKLDLPKNATAFLPWCELNTGLKEVHIDREYAAAWQRLVVPELSGIPEAVDLAQIARLLGGYPREPKQSGADESCPVILARAMCSVLGQTKADLDEVRTKLAAVRSDPALQTFQLLRPCAEVLELAVRALADDPTAREALLAYDLPSDVPAWAAWLFGRVAQITCDSSLADKALAKIPSSDVATAWFVECWWFNYGPDQAVSPPTVSTARAVLDTKLPQEFRALGNQIRSVRANRYHSGWKDEHRVGGAEEVFSHLGGLCRTVCEMELDWEVRLAAARASLADGNRPLAVNTLRNLLERMDEANPLSARWWRPTVHYALGVAEAASGQGDAAKTLTSLLEGPRAVEARAQLAMLSVQQNDLAAAKWWLTDLPLDFPAVGYAQAVLSVRSGEHAKAREILTSVRTRFAHSASPYRLAAQRLLAAVAEREGNVAEAERLHELALREQPDDSVTAARLGRLRIRRAYPLETTERRKALDSTETLLRHATSRDSHRVDWVPNYQLLCRLLVCPDAELETVRSEIKAACKRSESAFPWCQTLAWRLVAGQQPSDAIAVINRCGDGPAPQWHVRTRLLLNAWNQLSNAWPGGDKVVDGLATCVRQLEALGTDPTDPAAQFWLGLLRRAVQAGQAADSAPKLNTWSELGSSLMAQLPGLWAADASERRLAAEALRSHLQSAPSDGQARKHSLLRALTNWTSGRDDAFLDDYAELKNESNRLPVEAAALWHSAASIWFWRRNWKNLLDGDLPDCVADLSHARTRLLIGFAYVHTAAEESIRGDARSALQRVRQARSALEALAQSKAGEPAK